MKEQEDSNAEVAGLQHNEDEEQAMVEGCVPSSLVNLQHQEKDHQEMMESHYQTQQITSYTHAHSKTFVKDKEYSP